MMVIGKIVVAVGAVAAVVEFTVVVVHVVLIRIFGSLVVN